MEVNLEFRDYMRLIWRRRWLIILIFALASSAGLYFTAQQPDQFEATAKIFIGPRTARSDDAAAAIQELAFAREYVTSYAELLKSRPLAQRTIERLHLKESPSSLASRIKSQVIPETRIIKVTVTDGNQDRAALIANTLTDSFVGELQQEFGNRSNAQATVFEPAARPKARISPQPVRAGVFAGILGLALSIGIAVALEQLDTRIRTREDLERRLPKYPILAEVPTLPDGGSKRNIFIESHPKSPTAEAFRILRTNVQFLAVDHAISRVLVTSPYAEDGKTTVAANLAASLAAAGYRTLLIETDLRRPTVHDYFGMGAVPGITDVLLGRRSIDEAVRPTRMRDLMVLTSGPMPPNPSELLGSQRMVDVLDQAQALADVLVLDTPPALPVTDSTVLAPRTDGVILVVRSLRTHVDRAKEAIEQIERVGVRVLGIVLNEAPREESYYYSAYYRDAEGKVKQSERPRPGQAPVPEWSQQSSVGNGSSSIAEVARDAAEPQTSGAVGLPADRT